MRSIGPSIYDVHMYCVGLMAPVAAVRVSWGPNFLSLANKRNCIVGLLYCTRRGRGRDQVDGGGGQTHVDDHTENLN